MNPLKRADSDVEGGLPLSRNCEYFSMSDEMRSWILAQSPTRRSAKRESVRATSKVTTWSLQFANADSGRGKILTAEDYLHMRYPPRDIFWLPEALMYMYVFLVGQRRINRISLSIDNIQSIEDYHPLHNCQPRIPG